MRYYLYLFACLSFLFSFTHAEEEELTLYTIYGNIQVQDPTIIKLINSEPVQRLKLIHQYGIVPYVTKTENYNRYDHSIGVFALLHKYGLSREEQIAGILHDVSHTVFSHVGDFIFNHPEEVFGDSYQDLTHIWYLEKSGIGAILAECGLPFEVAVHKNNNYYGLEQELPNLCADRIDYNIQGGLLRGLITEAQKDQIIADLHFDEGLWYFTDPKSARLLADLSLNMTENLWGSAWNLVTYSWASEAIRRALEIGTVTIQDIHFSTDNRVWKTLEESNDPFIQNSLHKIKNYREYFSLVADTNLADTVIHGKFRGVDPLILTETGYKRLTQVDADYAQEYQRIRNVVSKGWFVQYTDPEITAFELQKAS